MLWSKKIEILKVDMYFYVNFYKGRFKDLYLKVYLVCFIKKYEKRVIFYEIFWGRDF